MDDHTFQQELARLKHRVSQMASTYHRSPVISQSQGRVDAFHHQLYDLKAQLEGMQTSISSSLSGTPTQAPATQLFQQANVYSPSPLATNALLQPHSQFSLPSGPLFWQLFTSLRTDVRSLDTRVADTEQHISDLEDRMQRNLSDLEDRVDKLEPSQFTPAASEDDTLNVPHDSYVQPAFQPSADIWSFDSSIAQVQDPWSAFSNDQWSTPSAQAFNFKDNSAACNDERPAYSAHLDYETMSPAAESVAFRDREIAQLDELMRKAQENIQHYDAVISEKDAQIQQLVSERDHSSREIGILQQTVAHRDNTIQKFREAFQEHNERLEIYEEKCQEKSEALYRWASKHQALEQSFLEKKTQLCHADRQVQQLQRALYDLRSSMADEMSQLTSIKEEEVKKLRDFCEAREGVVQQQEQIIARGANLLEDRDSELERMSQQMKGLDDDYRNETRERARFARLLDERDEEISQLKKSLSHALMPKHRQSKHEGGRTTSTPDREEKVLCYQPSPFATAGTPTRRSSSNAGQWTPKTIDNYTPLPHEQRRASAWKTGLLTAEQHHRFGVPGELASSTPSEERTPPGNNSRDLRRSDSVKLLQRLALVEEGGSRPTKPHAGALSVTKRSRLPLDNDEEVRPRLPPRKMMSVNELGNRAKNDGEAGHQRPISRHQSIQNFPRHKLQAYVEDGASGGEA